MAQLDARPTCDRFWVQPSQVGNILSWRFFFFFICKFYSFFNTVTIPLSWRFDHEIFAKVILSRLLIQERQLSVSGEGMCTILVNRLEDYACPVKVWLGKLTALDMTPMG